MSAEFLLTALIVCLIPGTGVIYTLATALAQGRRAALWAALGCTVGIVPHLAAAMAGLAAVLHSSAIAFTLMKYAGAGYLLWLSWQSLRTGGTLELRPGSPSRKPGQVVLRGALLNILNPKLSVFFLALLPPFLTGNPAMAQAEMASLGATFMAVTFATFAVYGLTAATTRNRALQSPRVITWMNRSIAALFAVLGLRLALERA